MSSARKRARPSEGGGEEDDDDLGSAVDDAESHAARRLRTTMDSAATEFVCPITQELPVDPVIAMDGKVYERAAIEEWIARGNGKSPMTNLPMADQLLPATHVRNSLELMVKSGALTGDKVDAWKKKIEDDKSVDETRAKAAAGDARSAVKLGMWLIHGKHGLKTNPVEAVGWLQRVADASDDGCSYRDAICLLGTLHINLGMEGIAMGMEASIPHGMAMMTEAALMGNEVACWCLGHIFQKGKCGAKKDRKLAAKWFRKMAQQCSDPAIVYGLAPAIKAKAIEWLSRYDVEQLNAGN